VDYKALTAKDVFELCVQIWSWMAEDTTREKRHWPGWKYMGGDVPFFENDCPVCEENLQNTYKCRDCVMPWKGGHCTEGEYEDWRNAKTDSEKRKAALSIVELAENELRKIVERGEI